MYSNSAAVFRPDLAGVIEQAKDYEQMLIGPKVAPIVSVTSKTGFYPRFNLAKGNLLRNEVGVRAPYGSFPRGTRSFEQDTYGTSEYGYEEAVDDAIAAEMSAFFSAEQIAAKLALRKLLIAHEVRVANLTYSTANYGAATNSGTAYTEANIGSFDVGLDIDKSRNRLQARGESTNDLVAVMSSDVFIRLRASTKLQNRLRGIGVAADTILAVDEQAVAEALGLRAVYVGKGYVDTSKEGQAASTSAIWGNTYIWVGKIGVGGLFGGGAQYTLAWSQYGSALTVETYRDEKVKCDIVRVSQHVTEKVVNGNAGDLIATQYS